MKKSFADPFDIELRECIRNYIRMSWDVLRRDQFDLAYLANDPKFKNYNHQKYVIHISPKQDPEIILKKLQKNYSNEELSRVEIKILPTNITQLVNHEGVLYLPNPYVVPGGRFNEMYGWDSYFIILGLLREDRIEMAKGMVDNLIYEIEYYDKLLCANRTYYLTRSQPPLVTRAVHAVYKYNNDKNWLISLLPNLIKLYQFWTTPPHLVEEIGLSRYYDFGNGPAPEVLSSEIDSSGLNHYQRVLKYYQSHQLDSYDKEEVFDEQFNELKAAFYKGDRSVRESGFDLSSRFGPFGAKTPSYLPVCLNTLLYRMEKDMSKFYVILNDDAEALEWLTKANKRAKLIQQYLWNDDLGYYFDYNFTTKTLNKYIYATTFYPLWAGIATREQAKRIVNNLCVLECVSGLLTSAYATGQQWDAPFGWAPLHYFAISGLVRYGYLTDAKRLALKFISLINTEFYKYNQIFEKYDLINQSSSVSDVIRFGYDTNEVGFGWTNAVYLELLSFIIP